MPSAKEIKSVNDQIINMQIPRIIFFGDVISRYAQTILKNKVSWLRTSVLIFIITRGGSLTPGQITRIMLRRKFSITKLIDGLEKDGLVKRFKNNNDRRGTHVKVTSEGLNYVISNLSNLKEAERELKSWLNDGQLENLAASIRILREKYITKISERYDHSNREEIF